MYLKLKRNFGAMSALKMRPRGGGPTGFTLTGKGVGFAVDGRLKGLAEWGTAEEMPCCAMYPPAPALVTHKHRK